MTTGGPPVIPHSLVGRDDCLACHQDGLAGAPQVPTDHVGRTSDVLPDLPSIQPGACRSHSDTAERTSSDAAVPIQRSVMPTPALTAT